MTRDQHIEICERCSNHTFSPKKGIICSLTNQQATFNLSCSDFKEDTKLAMKADLRKEASKEAKLEQRTFGLGSLGVKSGVTAGIVWIFIGLASMGLTIYILGGISFWSILIVVFGIVATSISASINSKNKMISESDSNSDDLLDDV